jgi:hypothetical protein
MYLRGVIVEEGDPAIEYEEVEGARETWEKFVEACHKAGFDPRG